MPSPFPLPDKVKRILKRLDDIDAALLTFASSTHNHDLLYSPLTHNHSGVYSPTTHNHDTTYSALGHSHTSDTGWINTGITFVADWTDGGTQYRIINGICYVRFILTRNTSALTGNFADNTMFTLPAGARPSIAQYGRGNNVSGTGGLMGYTIQTDGIYLATTTDNGATIAVGNSVRGTVSYPV